MISYTSNISNDPHRVRERTQIDKHLSIVPFFDSIQGLASIFTSFLISLHVIVGALLLLLLFCLSYIWASISSSSRRPSDKTLSTKSPLECSDSKTKENVSNSTGSLTAVVVLNSRSLFSNGLGGPDDLSLLMMRNIVKLLSKRINIAGLSVYIHLFRKLVRYNYIITKRIYSDQLNTILLPKFIAPLNTYLQGRTCFLDDVVEEFLRRHGNDINRNDGDDDNSTQKTTKTANVVILGAGYDSRCYRKNLNLAERGVYMFEVDAAGTQRDKLQLLEMCDISRDSITYVICDFANEDWLKYLLDVGKMDETLPTLFVWEGVTQYLSQTVVEDTLKKVSTKCAPGSCIAFDYFGTWAYKHPARHSFSKIGEALLFAVESVGAETLVKQNGLEVWDHIHDVNVIANLYLPHKYNGKHVGYLGDGFGGFIVAGKPMKQPK